MGFVISSDLTASTEGTNLRVGFGMRGADREEFTCLVTSETVFVSGSAKVKTVKGSLTLLSSLKCSWLVHQVAR